MDRPPKNFVFRISRREITVFSPTGEQILLRQNLRAIHDRPYDITSRYIKTPRTKSVRGVADCQRTFL